MNLKWGDRFAFGFQNESGGKIVPFTGLAQDLGITPVGDIRAVLFWPYLLPDSSFVTSTGKAMIFIATGITGDEWELAKSTTTAHDFLLLFRAGVGQRTDPGRQSVLIDPRWRAEWKQIARLEGEEAHAEVEACSL